VTAHLVLAALVGLVGAPAEAPKVCRQCGR